MSYWVEWEGKHYPASFFAPEPDPPRDTCPRCGGLGVVPEEIDEERYFVAFPCPECRWLCRRCGQRGRRSGHTCEGARP